MTLAVRILKKKIESVNVIIYLRVIIKLYERKKCNYTYTNYLFCIYYA